MAQPAAVARRTQRQRRESTRRRLLEATVEVLVARGHADTTTPAVCERAGLSQGALFRHFGSKGALLAAAAEHLFARLVEDFRAALPEGGSEEERARAAMRGLEAVFRSPRMDAAFELYVAARTDPELRASLTPVAAAHGENVRRQARAIFPEAARRNPDFDALVGLALSALQGAAVGRHANPDEDGSRAELRLLTEWVRRVVVPEKVR